MFRRVVLHDSMADFLCFYGRTHDVIPNVGNHAIDRLEPNGQQCFVVGLFPHHIQQIVILGVEVVQQ